MRKSAKLIALAVGVFLQIIWFNQLVGTTYGLAESTGAGGSDASAVRSLYGQTGSGVKVGIVGVQNVYIPHEAFAGINVYNWAATGLTTDPNWHDTMIAGILASGPPQGSSHSAYIGVAPGVEIHSMRIWSDIEEGLRLLVNTRNCQVIMTGFQMLGENPNGNSFTTLLYDYYASAKNIVFVNGAGNYDSRDPNIVTVSVPGDAYNTITTGGLILNSPSNEWVYRKTGSSSLPGLTVDGRRKPDVAAPSAAQTTPTKGSYTAWSNTNSYGGGSGTTSWAMPHTAGAAALLLGLANSTAEPNDGRNEVIKAVIINSTFPNVDDAAGNPTTGVVFDNRRGYGQIDVLKAYETLMQAAIRPGSSTSQSKGWAFNGVGPAGEDIYNVYIKKGARLKVTLAWDRRVDWTDKRRSGVKDGVIQSDELTVYFADLDVEVYEPNNSTAVFAGYSTKDNVEKCDVLAGIGGEYTIKVINKSATEAANYAIAFEGLPGIAGDFYPNDYIVDFNDLGIISSEWTLEAAGLEADLNTDDKVNFKDFAIFAKNWLTFDEAYYKP